MLPSRSPTGRTRHGEPAPPDARRPAPPDEGDRADAARALPLTRLRSVALPLVARLRAGRPSHEARALASLALAEAVARELPELPRAADVAANARAVEDFWDGLLTARAALDAGRRDRAAGGPEPDLSSLVVARCLLVAGLSARRAKAATAPPKRRAAPDERGWPSTRETKLRRVVEIVERHVEPWVRIGGAELISQEAAGLCDDLRRAFPEDFRNITLDRCREALARWSPGKPPPGRLSTNDIAALLIASAGPFKAAEATRTRLRRDIDRAVARAAPGPLRRAGPAG
ncbi:MAG TPA: hypothetical protein VFS43_42435 [Polyangiaceae bacterium]|nr:hypothetical protein [Polyangiaceae bacterium]